MKLALLLALLPFSSAFAPAAFTPRTLTPLRSDAAAAAEPEAEEEAAPPAPAAPAYKCITKAEIMSEPNCLEFGSVWDPLGLAELGSDEVRVSSSPLSSTSLV